MNIKEVMDKLDDFFDQSTKKQNKKHDKLLAIIDKLEQNKAELKLAMINESVKDETSEEFYDMKKELEVISKLLKKAKKHSTPEKETPDDE